MNNEIKMEIEELYHHGIKGQRWGVRRYQNKDGSLTSAGKKRAESDSDKTDDNATNIKKKVFDQTIKGGKDKPNISPAEKITKETGSMFENASKICSAISTIRGKTNSANNTMTDQELRDAVNRMNLEKQYNSLNQERTAAGMSYVTDILGMAGMVVGAIGSVATIVSTIKGLKK